MAKDATPDEIELKNDNFTNENHREIAAILEEEWDAEATFTELGERYEPHRATFQKVYGSYFGVPESEFNDGIDDGRTIQQLKNAHDDSYREYREARKQGDITTDAPHVEPIEGSEKETGSEPNSIDSDGFAKGWNMALKQAEEVGVENVPRMD